MKRHYIPLSACVFRVSCVDPLITLTLSFLGGEGGGGWMGRMGEDATGRGNCSSKGKQKHSSLMFGEPQVLPHP